MFLFVFLVDDYPPWAIDTLILKNMGTRDENYTISFQKYTLFISK